LGIKSRKIPPFFNTYGRWVGALSQAFEQAKNGGNNEDLAAAFHPSSPDHGAATSSRPLSVMSSNPQDYLAAHRSLSVSRQERRRSVSQRRRSIVSGAVSSIGGRSEAAYEPPYGTVTRKRSIFQKVKHFFRGEDDVDLQDRGRDYQDEATFAGRMRARSKSVARFLGLSEE
jgi:hypothetical protein